MPDPIAACGQSHSRRWHAQNVAKRPGGGYGGSATGEAQWPIGRRTLGRGIAPLTPPPSDAAINWRMGTFNGGQRPGLRRRDACVETRAGNAMKEGVTIVDWTLGTGDQRPTVGTLKSR